MAIKRKLITLYNQSPSDASVFVNGKRLFLHAFSEGIFDEEVAHAFMHYNPGIVVEAPDLTNLTAETVTKPTTVWVANMTGNPDAPSKMRIKQLVNKRWSETEVDNPAKAPRKLVERMAGTWVEKTDARGELTAGRKPWKRVEVPPYKRVEMTEVAGRWFLNRVAMARFGHNPAAGERLVFAIKARPPGAFEPDASWDLDELRAYFRYIEPTAKLPASEADIRARGAKSNMREDEIEFAIGREKRELMKRLFFRVVNPKGPRLPSREEFMQFLGAEAAPAEDDPMDILEQAEEEVQRAEA